MKREECDADDKYGAFNPGAELVGRVEALGDVGDDAQVAADLAERVAHDGDRQAGREEAAVTAAHVELGGVALGAGGERDQADGATFERPAGGVLIGVEDLRRGLVDQLVGPVAEEALGGGVHDPDGALGVGVDHRVFGTVEDGPLQAGGFAQLAFGAGVLVDLAGEAPVGVGQGADVAAEGVVGCGEGLGFLIHLAAHGVGAALHGVLDGDGQQDAAVLYTTAQTANVCIAILQRDDAGSWQVRQSVEGLAETVENVSLAQLQDTDSCQLVVGYTAAQNDHYLAVYSYQKGTLSTILEQQYEQYLVENITGGSSQDLILMSTQEDGSVQIELLTADRKGSFRQVAVNGLSADKFSGCASVAAGAGADGRHYLVLDGWTGISGNNLASVLLRFDEDTQQMVPADQISTEKLYTASLRNVPSLVSQDLDGDGIVEIPTQPDEAGLLNMSQSRRMDFIVWMDYTSPHPEKSFGLLDEETNCYIELPMEWEGNLKLTDSEEYDNAVELRTVDEDQLVLTVRLARTSANSTGWTRLGVVASRQVQAKMGPDVLLSDTNYRLSKALYLLN